MGADQNTAVYRIETNDETAYFLKLRSGVFAETAVTLYLDKAAFRRALDIPHEQEVWLYLFDKAGALVWRMAGAYAAEKGDALAAAVAHYLGKRACNQLE